MNQPTEQNPPAAEYKSHQNMTANPQWVAIMQRQTKEEAVVTVLDFASDIISCVRRLNDCHASAIHIAAKAVMADDPATANALIELGMMAATVVSSGMSYASVFAIHEKLLLEFKADHCPCHNCKSDRVAKSHAE